MTKDEALIKLELVTNRLTTADPQDDRSDPEWTALVDAVRILREVVVSLAEGA